MVINMLHQHWNPLGSVRKKTQVHINVPVLMMMMMMMFILWASRIGLNWNEKRKYWAVLSTWHCTCIYCKEILHIIISCMFYWLERCNNYFLNYFLLKAFENQSIWLEKLKLYGVFNNMQMVLLQRHLFNVMIKGLFYLLEKHL